MKKGIIQATSFTELAEKLGEAFDEATDDSKKILRRLPLKASWRKAWEECDEQARRAFTEKCKMDTMKQAFWAMIENETGDYTHKMAIHVDDDVEADDDGECIVVYANSIDR